MTFLSWVEKMTLALPEESANAGADGCLPGKSQQVAFKKV
jgi:hypothetical protein